jgi:hypothetical protein
MYGVDHIPSLILGYVRYVHSPVGLGLTSLRSLHSRVLQASEYFSRRL